MSSVFLTRGVCQVFRHRPDGHGSPSPIKRYPGNKPSLAQQEIALATPSKEARERAEQKFKKKEIEARDASKAMAEYQAGLVAQREKTARLRALREAREAAEVVTRAAQPPPHGDAGERTRTHRKTTTPA
jgi:hypothetical protein